MKALIIDTVSIQPYIFGSNKLKENIGASYIIEHLVYWMLIDEAFNKMGQAINMKHWMRVPQDPLCEGLDVGIGYIGGGNALLLFKDEKETDKFVRHHSLLVLQYFPGIQTAYAIGEFDETEFQVSRKKLNATLLRNKSLHTLNTHPLKHGIVEDCGYSNEAQETYFAFNKNEGKWISRKSEVKWRLAEYAHGKAVSDFIDNEGYTFTSNLEKFGQPEDKGYVAAVHIDGNGMGKKFMKCSGLENLRTLSKQVSDLANHTMLDLVIEVIRLFEPSGKLHQSDDFELKEDGEGNKILPLRPIITGGDDITFVCDGRLGVYLAEKFIELLVDKSHDLPDGAISACAGIAIVHTKYPFYRAYKLAEELCHEAKKHSREDNSSWLNYLISAGGYSGDLEEVRKNQYKAPEGSLSLGPYRLDDKAPSLKGLKEGIRHFSDHWPRRKVMALRDVLRQDEPRRENFLTEAASRGLCLPTFNYNNHDFSKTLWDKCKTPYYDMIELADFYPIELIK